MSLLSHGGTDQVARALAAEGWLGFERPLPDVLLRCACRFGGDVFDVGANTGIYSLITAAARRDVTVHAFEAFPPVLEMLHKNLNLQPSGRRVRVVPMAVAAEEGAMTLYVPRPTGSIETSCSLDPGFKEDIVDTLSVPAITLDSYWKSRGRPRVGTVKIDTEGTEHFVLAGSQDLIASERPVIFYEFLPRGAAEAIEECARRNDLVDFRLRPTEAVAGSAVVFDPQAWNHALVPREKTEAFAAVLQAANLAITQS